MRNKFGNLIGDASGYEEFKYIIQDSGSLYIGSKYTYGELLENELTPFKLKAVIEHYINKDTEPDTSLESHLYYMEDKSFSSKTYRQLRAKVGVSVLVPVKRLFSREVRYVYKEKIIPLGELEKMSLAKKKGSGIIIRELILSKLALMSFSI